MPYPMVFTFVLTEPNINDALLDAKLRNFAETVKEAAREPEGFIAGVAHRNAVSAMEKGAE